MGTHDPGKRMVVVRVDVIVGLRVVLVAQLQNCRIDIGEASLDFLPMPIDRATSERCELHVHAIACRELAEWRELIIHAREIRGIELADAWDTLTSVPIPIREPDAEHVESDFRTFVDDLLGASRAEHQVGGEEVKIGALDGCEACAVVGAKECAIYGQPLELTWRWSGCVERFPFVAFPNSGAHLFGGPFLFTQPIEPVTGTEPVRQTMQFLDVDILNRAASDICVPV